MSRLVDSGPSGGKRLQLFMGGRLGVATLLLGASLLNALDSGEPFRSFTPVFLAALIAAMYGMSLVFALWLRSRRRLALLVALQLAGDLTLTTALIYVTGGARSGFTFLYGVAVLMAAMVMGPTAARATGAASVVLYATLGLSLGAGVLPPPPDQSLPSASGAELAYVGSINVLALVLVTLLASALAGRLRTTGGQLKTLERLHEDIIRSLSAGLLTTDLRGRLLTINPWGAEMFRAPTDELLGRSVDDLLPLLPPDAQQGRDAGNLSRAEAVATRPDGSTFPVGYSTMPLLLADGSRLGTIVVFQDLTEVKQLREAKENAERLAVLGRLSAGLAHEIRNPLSSISGSVELVRDAGELQDEDRRLLGIVQEEVERLNELVTTMLQVGRPKSPERRDEDLNAMVHEVVAMVRRGHTASAGTRIDVATPAHPVVESVDGAQMRQVLWNLLKNAVQVSPAGSTIRVRVGIDDEGRAFFDVADEGVGLEPEQQDKLFDMFYSERTHGTGIGLALVRQIVDAHGASIRVDSARGRGATFRVTLGESSGEQLAQAVGR